ncbi:ATP-grasp domain-containing protein [Paludisphaera sp.]|uniref:ATP-grasp domain-containing protein n=1 Tax=Paludisphaera sp. TaxID=2017432 RepID=UPI00301BF82A
MTPTPPVATVLIVGASTRAAASSAARAGLSPRCLDLFADADLVALAPVDRFDPDRDADGLERLAAASPCDAWLYTGSMEARPDLVERLSRVAPLLGSSADVLRRIRDPWAIAEALRAEGLATPRLAATAPAAGRWLAKSTATAGGLGARWADAPGEVPPTHFQEFIDGPTFSALFVAADGRSRLVGVARQFPGVPGATFLYRGGVAPWPVAASAEDELRRIGATLARRFEPVGLFGVDFVLADGRPWVLEVNPRYTASSELFEYASGRSLMRDHIRACLDREIGEEADVGGDCVGKQILYARSRLTFPAIAPPPFAGHFREPPFADVPRPGTVIEPGEPILTVFARGRSPEGCLAELDRREAAWGEMLVCR